MASPYLNNLIQIAREELPQLAHDLSNASTIYTVQDAAKKILNILQYVVHHVILSDPSVAAAAAAQAKAAATPSLPPPPAGYQYVRDQAGRIFLQQIQQQAHVPVAAPVGHVPATDHFPSQVPVAAPAAPAASSPLSSTHIGLPPIGIHEAPREGSAPVMEVTITPQGSRVAAPGRPVVVMPPGVPVDAAAIVAPPPNAPGRIAVPGLNAPLVPVVPGVPVGAPGAEPVDVVVPGGMSPEVAAALAARDPNQQPILDAAGGARNVTNEP